jgi:hypothetical protein
MGTSQRLSNPLPIFPSRITSPLQLTSLTTIPGYWTSLPPILKGPPHAPRRRTGIVDRLYLTSDPPSPTQTISIFPCGSKFNWNREDDQQPVAGIAITYINNREVSHTACTLCFTAANFDADRCALVSATHQAQLFLNQRPAPQVTIFSINRTAIHAVTDLRPHAG